MSSFDLKSLEGKERLKGTILLLQSTQTECEQLRMPLSEIGFKVLTTTKPLEALQIYEKDHPDILIVSAFLSSGTTLDFCREIRIQHQDQKTPIIMTSAVHSGTLFVEARSKWGVNEVVILPTKFKKILHLILYYLGVESTRPTVLDDPSEAVPSHSVPIIVKAGPKKTLAPKGNLSDIGLDRLLRLMLTAKRSGILKVGSEEAVIRLHILSGQLVFVSSGFIQGFTLADYVQKENLVPADYLPALRKRMLEEKKLLGHLLLKVGLIEKDILDEALRQHIIQKALLPFKWQNGQYSYKNVSVQPPTDFSIEISLARLIFQGIRDNVDPDQYEKDYKNLAATIFRQVRSGEIDEKTMGFSPEEKRLFHTIDGTTPLSEILTRSQLQPEDIIRITAALLSLHLIKPIEEARMEAQKT